MGFGNLPATPTRFEFSWIASAKGARVALVRFNIWLLPISQAVAEAMSEILTADGVIIAGYGITGQELARSLGSCGMAYVVVDLNVENVHLARQNGLTAYFGDITSRQVHCANMWTHHR